METAEHTHTFPLSEIAVHKLDEAKEIIQHERSGFAQFYDRYAWPMLGLTLLAGGCLSFWLVGRKGFSA
jgi:hypothetical protein